MTSITTRILGNGEARYDVRRRVAGRQFCKTFTDHDDATDYAADDDTAIELAAAGAMPAAALNMTERGEAVRRLNAAGLNDTQVADRLAVTPTTVLRWRRRLHIPAATDRYTHRPATPTPRGRTPRGRTPEREEDDGEWRAEAACRGMACRDDDVWFDRDEPGPALASGRTRERRRNTAVALAFCRLCPVTRQCLRMAMRAEAGAPATRSRYGIFGGRTPRQRDGIAAAIRRKAS